MGKNKNGRNMADHAHDAVNKAKQGGERMLDDLDHGIDDVKQFNERVEGKAKNMAGKAHDSMDKAKNKAMETADRMDQDIADKASARMKERHS